MKHCCIWERCKYSGNVFIRMRIVMRTILTKSFISLVLVFCLGNSFLYELLHKHKSVNLHFHEEGALTNDHTQKVDDDCALCGSFFQSRFFTNQGWILLSSITLLLLDRFFSFDVFIKSILPTTSLGRSPPFLIA